MDTTTPAYAQYLMAQTRACQLGDAGQFAAANLIFEEANALAAQVPKAELTPEEKAVNWWHDELSINQQKAMMAQAGLPNWFPQYYGRSAYRSKLAAMHQLSQAAGRTE